VHLHIQITTVSPNLSPLTNRYAIFASTVEKHRWTITP
jgi:hypothetical protein